MGFYPQSTFYPMSNDDSTFHRWIIRPCFHICSTRRSHSQAHLYPYALRAIATRAECAFGLLRYFFGGNRPSQTDPLTLFRTLIQGKRLDIRLTKGGISPLTPLVLAQQLHSLPPILHMNTQIPISDYSKGSWGLSVLLRVSGIFTGITTSPRSTLRQCNDRYTIRAGRNLPDKEFRYLRTVIVTADIHRGFRSMLRLAANKSL
eukprot:TRINITY_DN5109_c0_g1_i5.p1 TRINITY_DN5109_c0_g1~~TRINITY_DN5109_c0_g1_i5.p1  ORF type:complete len:204 (-),score=-43.23 TRINITY_DN5109_c0_g1_i5:184-795(-)